MGQWVQGPGPAGVFAGKPFTYYVAIPGGVDGDCKINGSVSPLMNLLARNDMEKATLFKDWKARGKDAVLWFSSSDVTAMTVAFYAYQDAPLVLLQVNSLGLLNDKAPYPHPFGSFWPLGIDVFTVMAQKGEIAFQTCAFEMSLTETGSWVPHWEINNQLRKDTLTSKKRKLENSMAHHQTEATMHQKEINRINKELSVLSGK